ncbi:copper resistance CopC/CopD family protein [Streptomyces nodosus]|uniref:copper resistance CopC/CopD family protein n=1 Tax=Streptomyces nodosus TaxID=40318 RepID=UPI0037FC0B5C
MSAGRRGGGGRGAFGREGRPLRLVFVLFAVLSALLVGAGPASAHAVLKSSDPVDGTVLKTSPEAITLAFSESVGLLENSIRVFDPGNRRVHTGRQQHADGRANTAHITLPDLEQGTYIVAWRVVSADSHPASGALTFSVGKPSATTAVLPADTVQDTASTLLHDLTRYLAYGGLALLLGAGVFAAVTGTPAARGLVVGGWWTLGAATLAQLLLRGPYERGSGLGTVFDLSVLRETATSRPGLALLARLAVLIVAAPVAARAGLVPARGEEAARGGARTDDDRGAGGPLRWATAGAGTLALALTWAMAEHASVGIQVPLAMTSAVLHLLAMAVWLGGLTALLTALYRVPEDLPAAAVARFSRLAFAAVAVLVVTGVYQSWRGLGPLDSLTSTPYGRLLTVKVIAVVLMLVAAAFSRRWTARLAAPQGEGTAPAAPERAPVREAVAAAAGRTGGAPRGGGPEDIGGETGADTAPGDRAPETGRTESAPNGPATDAPGAPDAVDDPDALDAADGADDPDDPGVHRRALRRSVQAEITIGIVVLVITTLLTGTQPGRAAAEEAAARTAAEQPLGSTTVIPFDVGTSGGHGTVQIELTPSRVGENQVQAVVYGPDDGIVTVPELRLTFSLDDRDIGPLDAKVRDRGGYWVADALNLPLPGTWTIRATVRTSDIDQATVSKTVRIG